MNIFKITSLIALCLFTLCLTLGGTGLFPSHSAWAEPDDDRIAEVEDVVIAQINDEIITRRDVERELKMDRKYRGRRISATTRKELEGLRGIRQETLERLIERRLLIRG